MSSVFLRAFEQNDYILINKWRNDPQIQKLTCGDFRYVSSEREKEWVRDKMMNNQTDNYLAICLNNDSQEMIGYISVNNINHLHRTADGGAVVIGNYTYRDGATLIDALKILLSFVFDTLNINRFTGFCLEDHKYSRLIMESFLYKLEGCKREAVYKNGAYHNELIYSILREEYYSYIENGEYELMKIAKRIKLLNKTI